MRSLVASVLVCLGWAGAASAEPTDAPRPQTPAETLRLAVTEPAPAPGTKIVDLRPLLALPTPAAPQRRRLGLGLPSLKPGLAPSFYTFRTPLGPVRLEFFSLDQLRFKGSLVAVLDDASPRSSPSTIFDRTDLLDELTYVVTLPILSF